MNLRGKIDVKCISFYFFFRSLRNSNCLYSSASIYLFGNNNHLNELRWLTSIELYENAKFYCQRHVLLECLKVHSRFSSNFNSICSCCLYQKSFNSFVSIDIVKSVKDKAIYNLRNGQYCSFYVYWLYQLLQVHKLIAFIQVLDRKSIDCYLIMLLNQVSVTLLQLIM